MHQVDPVAPVGFLKFNSLALEFKLPALDLQARLDGLPLKDSFGYVSEDEASDELILTNDEAGMLILFFTFV